LFHLPDGSWIIGQFVERVGRSGTSTVGAAVVGADRGASSPLTKGAVSATAAAAVAAAAAAAVVVAAAAAGSILLSTVILVAGRVMIAQSRLLLARGL